jgi:Kef-type K+ transport system membrane component KefB
VIQVDAGKYYSATANTIFISTLLGWITKTSLYTSFIGYVAGGIVIGTLFTVLGLGAPDTSQLEVLKSIGLTSSPP